MPVLTPDGTQVISVVDEAEVWLLALESRVETRLDDGRHDFCMDPATGCVDGAVMVCWQGWSVPHMAWDRSDAVTCRVSDGTLTSHGTHQTTQPRFLSDGTLATLRDDHGWLNLWLGDQIAINEPFEHGNPTWGPGARSYAASPSGHAIAVSRNESGFGRLQIWDRNSKSSVDIGRGVHSSLSWVGDTIVAIRSGARTPTQVVAYTVDSDVASGTATRRPLMVGPALGWESHSLVEPEVHRAVGPAGDVPLRRYVAGQGAAIVMVHGGPTDQWRVEFNPRIAYWCSRGFDVVVVDPRGSTGHGRAMAQALRGGWGVADVADVEGAIRYVHASGWSTPATTALTGSSSGGLTVLGVLCGDHQLVAAGIAAYPVSDIAALLEVDHRFEAHYPISLVGEPGSSGYVDGSPRYRIDRLSTPLLLLHGTDDPVVPVTQSRELVARAPTGVIEYHEFDGEGHGFSSPATRREEFARVEDFLRRHLTITSHA